LSNGSGTNEHDEDDTFECAMFLKINDDYWDLDLVAKILKIKQYMEYGTIMDGKIYSISIIDG
jgi:hypothetical protein